MEDHGCQNDKLPLTPEIVQNLLLQMDHYKYMVPDGIYLRILKELADVITKSLLMIFEQFWEYREVPADWKLANFVKILKGKKEDPKSYRPVSVISVAS